MSDLVVVVAPLALSYRDGLLINLIDGWNEPNSTESLSVFSDPFEG